MGSRTILLSATAFLITCLSGPMPVYAAGPLPVDLLTAGNFTILSETGITNTGSHTTVVTGDIGSSPITAAAMDNVFCSEMIGTIYGVDAAYVGSGIQTCFAGNPPLGNKTLIDNAILDMETAYTDAAGRILPDAVGLFGGNLGGQTIPPGLYKWSTDVSVPTDVTLSGGASDVWIFQIAGNLDIASGGSVPSGTKIVLLGGAQASNIFWQVGGVTGATLGTNSTFNGNILTAKQIIIQTGAVLNGRALAQTQVTLDSNSISPTAVVIPATIHIIKNVVNNNAGTSTSTDFNIYIKNLGFNLLGSPSAGTSTPGTSYSVLAGTYVISEDASSSYNQSFSGACDSSGNISILAGEDKTCIITNTDIAPIVPPSSGGGSSSPYNLSISFASISTTTALVENTAPVNTTNTTDTADIIVLTLDQPSPEITNTTITPGFPNTGLPPEEGIIGRAVLLSSIFMLILTVKKLLN